MKKVDTYGTFEEAISQSNNHIKEITKRIRQLIIEIYPDVVEVPWPNQGIVGYGVGPKKMSEHFCYIGLYRDHVNLGFYYGAVLSDPDGLLEGTGRKLRHIKIKELGEVDQPSLRHLIELSLVERRQVLKKVK